jgi:hypothetical protein
MTSASHCILVTHPVLGDLHKPSKPLSHARKSILERNGCFSQFFPFTDQMKGLLHHLLMNAWGNALSSTVFGVTIRIYTRHCCDPAIQK